MNAPTTFPSAVREFIDSSQWTFAKTMPEWPHEYLVRGRVDEKLFVQLVRYIRLNGYEGKFYQNNITYFDEAGSVYWTMGELLEETIIVNRCRKEDSYEYRLLKGTLPASKGIVTEKPGGGGAAMRNHIDTTFDFRSDTPPGKDADSHSPTLRSYHKRLWSKPLPNGVVFALDDTYPGA